MEQAQAARDGSSGAPGRPRNARAHAAILQATTDLLAETGYSNLTIEGVAARAGVGKSTVYRWWPNKAKLVLEAMRQQAIRPVIVRTGDPREDLRALIHGAMSTLTSPTTSVVLPALAADLLHDPVAAEGMREVILSRRKVAFQIVRDAVDQGLLPANVDAALLLDIYSGAIFYRMLMSKEPLTERMTDQLVELLLDGTTPTIAP